MGNQPGIVLVDKQRETAIVIDVAIQSNTNIRNQEPGMTSENSVQKIAVLGPAKILFRTLKPFQLRPFCRGSELKGERRPTLQSIVLQAPFCLTSQVKFIAFAFMSYQEVGIYHP